MISLLPRGTYLLHSIIRRTWPLSRKAGDRDANCIRERNFLAQSFRNRICLPLRVLDIHACSPFSQTSYLIPPVHGHTRLPTRHRLNIYFSLGANCFTSLHFTSLHFAVPLKLEPDDVSVLLHRSTVAESAYMTHQRTLSDAFVILKLALDLTFSFHALHTT